MTTLEFSYSKYNPIWIYEKGKFRCMAFDKMAKMDYVQGCMNLEDSNKVELENYKIMVDALALRPKARRILIVGLGSAILPKAISSLNPEVIIDVVEIDKLVLEMAEKYFNFHATANVKVHIENISTFLKQNQRAQYDLIFMDAFDSEDVPPSLLNEEFAKLTSHNLATNGILVVNDVYNNLQFTGIFLKSFKFSTQHQSQNGDVKLFSNQNLD